MRLKKPPGAVQRLDADAAGAGAEFSFGDLLPAQYGYMTDVQAFVSTHKGIADPSLGSADIECILATGDSNTGCSFLFSVGTGDGVRNRDVPTVKFRTHISLLLDKS